MSDLQPSIKNWPYTKAKTSLLRAAAAVMRERGPRAATLKNVATRAGVTEPAIFRHFPGVDGVFAALADSVERIYDSLEDSFSGKARGIARYEEGMRAAVGVLASHPDLAYLLLSGQTVFREYPELRERLTGRRHRLRSLVGQSFSEAKAKGELKEGPNAETIARIAEGTAMLTLRDWMDGPKDGDDPVAAWESGWTELRSLFVRKRP